MNNDRNKVTMMNCTDEGVLTGMVRFSSGLELSVTASKNGLGMSQAERENELILAGIMTNRALCAFANTTGR